MLDGRLCDVIESNEDIAHDSKVGRLVSGKNEQRGIPRVPARSCRYLFERVACVYVHSTPLTLCSPVNFNWVYRKFNLGIRAVY